MDPSALKIYEPMTDLMIQCIWRPTGYPFAQALTQMPLSLSLWLKQHPGSPGSPLSCSFHLLPLPQRVPGAGWGSLHADEACAADLRAVQAPAYTVQQGQGDHMCSVTHAPCIPCWCKPTGVVVPSHLRFEQPWHSVLWYPAEETAYCTEDKLTTSILLPALLLTFFEALDKSLCFSMPQFPN